MEWIELTAPEDLATALADSQNAPVLILKHSPICSLSSVALNRLERSWDQVEMTDIKLFFLNVIGHRDLTRLVQDQLEVRHESPQLLLVRQRQCVYHASHWDISYKELVAQVNALRVA